MTRADRAEDSSTTRERLNERARAAFTEQWSRDQWELDSDLDRASHEFQLSLLAGRRYARALEIGCGKGAFTERLMSLADRVVALDIAPNAIACARDRGLPADAVDFRVANVMDYDPRAEGPWDLVVMSETIYCLGWLYPFFDIGWLVSQLFSATRSGGRVLMANTYGGPTDYLLLPWLIDTYRDLFLNIGYEMERAEQFGGVKNGVELRIQISVFRKP